MNLRNVIALVVLACACAVWAGEQPETTEPPGVLTPALQAKLAVLKQRGLDYSDARAFWPLGDGDGMVLRTMGTLGNGNAWLLASAAIDCEWSRDSRFKGQAALRFKPHLATVNGGERVIIGQRGTPIPAYTIAGWSRPEWFQGGGMILHEGWLVNGFSLYLTAHKSKAIVTSSIFQGGKNVTEVSPEVDLPGGWAHTVTVYDGPHRSLVVYVNGKRVAEKEVPWTTLKPAGKGWRIGGSDPLSGMGGQFNGVIDEVAVWDRALSGAEILNLYERGKPDPGTEIKPVQRLPPVELTASQLPTSDQVLVNFDFENTLAPAIVSPDRAASQAQFFRECSAPSGNETVKANFPRFREGKFGRGLYLGNKGNGVDKGEAFQFDLGKIPSDEGSILLWFKPDWAWGKGVHRLFDAGYVNLNAMVEGERVIVYCGRLENGQPTVLDWPWAVSKEVKGTSNAWHQLVVAWYRDGTAQLFFDGKSGQRTYAPLRDFGGKLVLGAQVNLAGTERDTGLDHPDCVFDEVTVLKQGLSPAQVAKLYALDRPYAGSAEGFFCTDGRTAFRRGEKISWHFRCQSNGTFSVVLKQKEKSWPLFAAPVQKTLEVHCDTETLRPGEYVLQATLVAADGRKFTQERPVVIRDNKEPPITFGVLGYMRDEKDEDRIAEAGFDHIRGSNFDLNVLDRLYRKGLSCSPTLDCGPSVASLLKKSGVPPEQWRQLWWHPDGKSEWVEENSPSPLSPVTQDATREMLRSLVAPLAGHPGFKYLCLYDEYLIRTDISPAALAYFKARTGLDAPPDFKPRPAGTIVPDDDPFVRWIDTFGVDFWMNANLGVQDQVCTAELHRIAPGARTFSSPSSGMGEIDFECPEIYPYLIETPLNRYLGKPELMADAMMEIYNAAQRVRPRKPQWPLLGWYNMPGMPAINESVRVLIEICLAKGSAGVLVAPDTWVRNRPDMIATVRQLSDFSRRYGPMLRSLRYNDLGTVAVLWNEYSVLGDGNPGSPRGGGGPALYLLPPLRAAGIPVEVISPADVLAGRLDTCDALILAGYTHTKKSLHDRVLKFAERGGLVIADDLSTTRFLPQGTARLPWRANEGFPEPVGKLTESIQKLILPRLKHRPVLSSDWRVVPYRAVGSDCQVYFVINTDLHESRSSELSVEGEMGVLYDLVAGKAVTTHAADGRLKWSVDIEKGGWRVYVRRAAPVAKVELECEAHGASLSVVARVLDHEGKYAAQVPVQVRITDAEGKPTPYGSWAATGDDGTVKIDVGVASMTDTPGQWHVEATELLSGQDARVPVTLQFQAISSK